MIHDFAAYYENKDEYESEYEPNIDTSDNIYSTIPLPQEQSIGNDTI